MLDRLDAHGVLLGSHEAFRALPLREGRDGTDAVLKLDAALDGTMRSVFK